MRTVAVIHFVYTSYRREKAFEITRPHANMSDVQEAIYMACGLEEATI